MHLYVKVTPVLATACLALVAVPLPLHADNSQLPGPCGLASESRLNAADLVQPPGLPLLGMWMIDPDGSPAHWLGESIAGKALREPINVVFVDGSARSVEDAKARLVAALAAAGYPSRMGHSSGYKGCIGGALHPQLPEERDHAFSNAPYEFTNNHGRVFGPYRHEGAYVFIAGFSRESVDVLANPKHQYVSFNQARDDVAQKLDRQSAYRIAGYENLKNVLIGDPAVTTGDHDGVAVVLRMAP